MVFKEELEANLTALEHTRVDSPDEGDVDLGLPVPCNARVLALISCPWTGLTYEQTSQLGPDPPGLGVRDETLLLAPQHELLVVVADRTLHLDCLSGQ